MEALTTLLQSSGFASLGWQNLVMFAVGGLLIYLAVTRQVRAVAADPHRLRRHPGEPAAGRHGGLAPTGTATAGAGHHLLQLVYDAGIRTEFLPPVVFLGVGALTDFRPLLGRPITFLLGGGAVRHLHGGAGRVLPLRRHLRLQEAAAIGIIGGADGPTSIFLAAKLAPAPAGRHRRGRLQLHGARAGDPAAHHAALTTRRERALPAGEVGRCRGRRSSSSPS